MRRGDWAWPLGILALGMLEMVAMSHGVGTVDTRQISASSAAAGMVTEAMACGLLTFRRRWPVGIALAVSVLGALLPTFGIHMDEPVTPILILGLAMFAAGRYRADGWAFAAPLGATIAPFVAKWWDYPGQVDITDAFFIMFILGAPFAFGRLALRQAQAHVREQERVRREAIATERVRIARELHDVLAHSISSMVIQANMGADSAMGTPAADAFSQIADTGRSALTDVGLMLRLLRADDAQDSPNPTAADIPALVDRFRRAGLTVEPADVDLGSQPLGAAVDLSVYRVVQEALTNSLKHAGGGPTTLHVVDSDDGISIEVTSGRGDLQDRSTERASGAGQGLIGMRERVEMFGGTLHAGPGPDGSFEIRALIPREAVT
jgi:signal transduction histidine kinase